MSVSYKRKTAWPFFSSRLHKAIASSAQQSRASPMREKRCRRFSPHDLKEQIRAAVVRSTSVSRSLSYFCVAKIRDYFAKIRHGLRAVRRARSAKFPAQDLRASLITQRAVNVVLCVLIRNRSRLVYLLLHSKR